MIWYTVSATVMEMGRPFLSEKIATYKENARGKKKKKASVNTPASMRKGLYWNGQPAVSDDKKNQMLSELVVSLNKLCYYIPAAFDIQYAVCLECPSLLG